ncbi:MAG: sodium:solute symporter [bacterium]|nr:sodium:solute symporter [bacterium]
MEDQLLQYLSKLDYGIIGIYLVLILGLGVYLSRRASASLEDYFLGGRNLPWWALGISGMAKFLDVTGTMLIVSFLFMLGPRGLFIEFRGGAVLILVITLLWTGKWHRRSGCITSAEWMIYRFGEGVGGQFARIITALAAMVGCIGALAYLIKGVGLFFSMFLPFSPLQCALIMFGVATLYTMMSGFYGVVFTDMAQALIIVAAVIAVSVMAIVQVGDGTQLAELAERVTGSTSWMSCRPHWHTSMPPGYEPYRDLMMFALFYLLKNLVSGMGMGNDPQYFGARNERACGTLTFLWTWLMMLRWPMMMGFAVLGLYVVNEQFPDQSTLVDAAALIKQHQPGISELQWPEVLTRLGKHPAEFPEALITGLQGVFGQEWETKLKLLSYQGTINPERILPAVILFKVPAGLRGVILAALIAASMSTIDSTLNQTGAYFTRDVYQRYLRPKAPNRELLAATYTFTAVMVAGGFAMAYTARSINDIWEWIAMGLGGGMLVPGILKFYGWRFNAGGVVMGTAAGLIGALVQRWQYPDLDGRLQFLVLGLVGLVGAVAGTYLTRPTEPGVLTNFYRSTRPFGLWGPLKRALAPPTRAAMTREHRNDLLAVPFTLGWHITLFILPMLLIIRNLSAFWVTLVIFVVCLSGMYVFWYRNLPPASAGVRNRIEDYP